MIAHGKEPFFFFCVFSVTFGIAGGHDDVTIPELPECLSIKSLERKSFTSKNWTSSIVWKYFRNVVKSNLHNSVQFHGIEIF